MKKSRQMIKIEWKKTSSKYKWLTDFWSLINMENIAIVLGITDELEGNIGTFIGGMYICMCISHGWHCIVYTDMTYQTEESSRHLSSMALGVTPLSLLCKSINAATSCQNPRHFLHGISAIYYWIIIHHVVAILKIRLGR